LDQTDYMIGKLPEQPEVQITTRSDQTLRPN